MTVLTADVHYNFTSVKRSSLSPFVPSAILQPLPVLVVRCGFESASHHTNDRLTLLRTTLIIPDPVWYIFAVCPFPSISCSWQASFLLRFSLASFSSAHYHCAPQSSPDIASNHYVPHKYMIALPIDWHIPFSCKLPRIAPPDEVIPKGFILRVPVRTAQALRAVNSTAHPSPLFHVSRYLY
jgi:hypothetical protein